MTTLVKQFEKQVKIPSDRRLTIDLPLEVPAGDARVTMKIEYGKRINRLAEV